jgi:thiosulfate reductase cytochrome b subunit
VTVTLASELLEKTLWYPTILGVLVVVAGIALFVGSIYLLLGTNLGARLGFLVTFTGLMGFMVVLTLLWCTTASPLNTLKGRIPEWG